MPLPTRLIGNTPVPYPGLGTMGMNSAWYAASGSEQDMIAVLKAAYDMGCRHWDTADIYGATQMGDNERLVGKALRELKLPRKDMFIATKFGYVLKSDGGMDIDGSAGHIKSAIEQSLTNLGVEYVDLYYLHRVDKNTPIEETVRAMKELRDAGKIRHIGLSECSAQTLRRAAAVATISAVQTEYSLFSTDIETNGVLAACKELGVALVAYSPLGRGMLSGKFKIRADLEEGDSRLFSPRFSEEAWPGNLKLVEKVGEIAARKGYTSGQLALAWVYAQWEGAVAIPGTTRLEALKENVASAHISLSAEELAEIRSILDTFPVQGERYDEWSMTTVNI